MELVRIRGCFSAERCSETIANKLSEFEIDFDTDIVAVTTDGCSMIIGVVNCISYPWTARPQ